MSEHRNDETQAKQTDPINSDLDSLLESQDEARLIESLVEQFETQWLENRTTLSEFLQTHPLSSLSAKTELIRCDMEFQWCQGMQPTLEDYETLVPELRCNPRSRSLIAFEECRQRVLLGQSICLDDFAKNYNIDVADWPRIPSSEAQSNGSRSSSDASMNAALSNSMPLDAAALEALSLDAFAGNGVASKGVRLNERSARRSGALNSSTPRRWTDISSFQPGDRLGDFTLVGRLGAGAQGSVYLATQSELSHRFVVLKIYRHKSREPQLLAELQHTNIMPILSLHRHDGGYIICMPFLGAATLRDFQRVSGEQRNSTVFDQACVETVLSRKSREIGDLLQHESLLELPRDRHPHRASNLLLDVAKGGKVAAVLWLGQQIAEGLKHAHQRGIVHGDLKPANILISDDGYPLLLDFHLSQARAVDGAIPEGGTLPYMAPEHLLAMQSDQAIDRRSDIFSLGVVLYELLADRPPFPTPASMRSTSFEELARQRSLLPSPLVGSSAGFTFDLDSIIRKCLAPDPEDRYQSCDELLIDLNRHEQSLPLIHAPNRSWKERAAKWWRRNGSVARTSVIVATLFCAVLLLGGFLTYRSRQLHLLDVQASAENIQTQFRQAIVPLTAVGERPESIREAIENAQQLLSQREAGRLDVWQAHVTNLGLNRSQAEQERELIAQLFFWLAHAHMQLDTAAPEFDRESLRELNRQAAAFAENKSLLGAVELQARSIERESLSSILDEDDSWIEAVDSAEACLMIGSALSATEAIRSPVTYGQTTRLLMRATEMAPDHFAAWILLGNHQIRGKEYDQAIASFSVAIALAPDNPRGYFHRARAAFDKGDFASAEADFRWIVEQSPASTLQMQVHERFNWVTTLVELGDVNRARQNLDWILVNTTRASAQFLWTSAKNHAALGNREQAKDDLIAATQSQPATLNEWISQGLCFYQLGQVDQAIASFEQASLLFPDEIEPHQNLAHLWAEEKQNPSKAIESLNRVMELQQHDEVELAISLATRAVLAARMKDRTAAMADIGQALELRSDATILCQAACVYSVLSSIDLPDFSTEDEATSIERAVQLLAEAAWLDCALVRARLDRDPDLAPLRFEPAYQKFEQTLLTLESWQSRSSVEVGSSRVSPQ